MKICAIIPARYDSKRLPGKPLIILNKKTILEKTYRQIAKVIDEKDIYVLTDSNKVINTLKNKIKNFVLTPKIYNTGVERCAHNFKKIKKKYKGYLIVSCDFPHIPTLALKETIKNFCKIANIKNYAAATVHTSTKDKSIIKSTKIPKIILNNQNDILYLSRFPIPSNYKKKITYHVHHGPICIKSEALLKMKNFKYINLSLSEENEWLQFIENGFKIRSSLVKNISREINDKKDLTFYKKKFIYRN